MLAVGRDHHGVGGVVAHLEPTRVDQQGGVGVEVMLGHGLVLPNQFEVALGAPVVRAERVMSAVVLVEELAEVLFQVFDLLVLEDLVHKRHGVTPSDAGVEPDNGARMHEEEAQEAGPLRAEVVEVAADSVVGVAHGLAEELLAAEAERSTDVYQHEDFGALVDFLLQLAGLTHQSQLRAFYKLDQLVELGPLADDFGLLLLIQADGGQVLEEYFDSGVGSDIGVESPEVEREVLCSGVSLLAFYFVGGIGL